jgi:ATP-dependent Clp protease ATP-binding subunit ClpA
MHSSPPLSRPYTSRAVRALTLADSAADAIGDEFIATEHLLLGLLGDPKCPAAQILTKLGVTAETVRAELRTSRRAART